MDPASLLPNETRLEENFRAAEALIANSDDVAIWKLIGLLLVRALACSFHLTVKVQSDVGELLFHIPHNLALCCCCEGVATLCQDLHQIFCQVATRKVQTQDCMGQRIAFIDWHCVR